MQPHLRAHRKKQCFNENTKLHLMCFCNPYYGAFCVFQTHVAVFLIILSVFPKHLRHLTQIISGVKKCLLSVAGQKRTNAFLIKHIKVFIICHRNASFLFLLKHLLFFCAILDGCNTIHSFKICFPNSSLVSLYSTQKVRKGTVHGCAKVNQGSVQR